MSPLNPTSTEKTAVVAASIGSTPWYTSGFCACATRIEVSKPAIAAATHPVRAALLAAMRQPTTAAAAARATGQSRQNAAYHVRELVKLGLLRHAGERRRGNFVEQLYVTAAPTIVVSPRSTWGGDPRRLEALADQLSLGELVALGERLTTADHDKTPEGELRWRYAARRARQALVAEGVMTKGQPGLWSLAD